MIAKLKNGKNIELTLGEIIKDNNLILNDGYIIINEEDVEYLFDDIDDDFIECENGIIYKTETKSGIVYIWKPIYFATDFDDVIFTDFNEKPFLI
ncbi:hypothetical protein M0Q50_07290 [bacterium]|jgi:hypothetical protein|nr:hypothetical protein [bacterium]